MTDFEDFSIDASDMGKCGITDVSGNVGDCGITDVVITDVVITDVGDCGITDVVIGRVKKFNYTYITRHINGRFYVGRHSTDNLDDGYKGSGNWVKSILDKSTITTEILEFFDDYTVLKAAEVLLINSVFGTPGCMNYTRKSNGFLPGVKITEETKRKISESLSGEKNPNYGMTGELSPSFGFKHSVETRALWSEQRKGEKNAQYGKIGTNIGKIFTQEHCDKIGATRKGELHPFFNKKHSKETRALMLQSSLKGENHKSVKLTEVQVLEIRKYAKENTYTRKQLSIMYGVSKSLIDKIINRNVWKHI